MITTRQSPRLKVSGWKMRIIELDEVDSTNQYIKRQNFAEDTLVFAARQTAGKGTKGRSFCSENGGLYASILHIYEHFPAENAFKIMISACVAVCKTIENFGIKPRIRWANDVLIGDKKICGTLIENTLSGAMISRSIIGIGLNVNNVLPEDLRGIAVTLGELKNITFSQVKSAFVDAVEREYTLDDYRSYIDWLGGEVIIREGQSEFKATAIDIADDGRLIIKIMEKERKISAAEVSLRLK